MLLVIQRRQSPLHSSSIASIQGVFSSLTTLHYRCTSKVLPSYTSTIVVPATWRHREEELLLLKALSLKLEARYALYIYIFFPLHVLVSLHLSHFFFFYFLVFVFNHQWGQLFHHPKILYFISGLSYSSVDVDPSMVLYVKYIPRVCPFDGSEPT